MAAKAIKAGMATRADARLGMLPKAPTGISGLDEVTGGGLPRGRPTLVCGPAGCGKTLLAMEFLVRGITEFDEPGVFVAFEESAEDLIANVASLGFDLAQFEADGRWSSTTSNSVGSEMEETGEWDLEGLFLRLGAAIDEVGAKRVVIDTIETMFGVFSNTAVLRTELRRLFGWLKERGVTAVITAERGDGTLTRYGIEEYVSDCVIVLDHRVSEQASTRRLRILKYRGSLHGTNEYPFLIGESGISVLPITVARLAARRLHRARVDRRGTARRDARRRRLLQGRHRARERHRGHRQVDAGGAVLRRGVHAAASGRCTSRSRSPRRRSSATWVRSASTFGAGWTPVCCGSIASARRFSALRATCSRCRSTSASSTLPSSSRTRSQTSLRVGSGARRVPDADASGRLPEGQRGDGAVHQPRLRGGAAQADQQIASLVDTWLRVKTMEGNGELNRAPVRAQVARDGELQPDPRVSAHQPGDRVGRRVCRPAGRAHRLGPPGPGGPGGRRRDGADGGPRAAPDQPRTPTRGRRGADRDAVARVRRRSRQRGPPAQPRLDRRRGSRRPTRRAGPTPRRRHRSAGAFRPPQRS